jgi:hypothetical protein
MDKRYQVFVSSTYEDLQEERREVMHALLELECIPAGMELFPAANEDQWSLIRKVIDDCDYYVLILAGRYGSCDTEGAGYTEKEYTYAVSAGKPVIAFLHKDLGAIPAKKCESKEDGKKKLEAFRSIVQGKLCKYWSSPAELGSVVSRSLIQLIKSTPAIGWVRADELPTQEATLELLKLRKQVDELQSELARVRVSAPKGSEHLAQGEDEQELDYEFTRRDSKDRTLTKYTGKFFLSWNTIFGTLSPLMISDASDYKLKSALVTLARDRNVERLRKQFAGDTFLDFAIMEDSFHTVKVQLRALGLIIQSNRARSVKDRDTYWTLTPYGDEIMTQVRAIKKPQ